MIIESLGQTDTSVQNVQQQTVSTDDFLELFLAQLNYQDPLEPVDNREFITQLAEFSSLQLANDTNSNIENLLRVMSINQSVGLLGKEVSVSSSSLPGGTAIGEVIALDLQGDQPLLSVSLPDGEVIRISPASVSIVRDKT